MVRFSDMLGGDGEPDATAQTAARDLPPLVDDAPPDADAAPDDAPPEGAAPLTAEAEVAPADASGPSMGSDQGVSAYGASADSYQSIQLPQAAGRVTSLWGLSGTAISSPMKALPSYPLSRCSVVGSAAVAVKRTGLPSPLTLPAGQN